MPLNERDGYIQKATAVLTARGQRWGKWAQRWNMKFNLCKYKVMYLDRLEDSLKYSLNGAEFVAIKKKKD